MKRLLIIDDIAEIRRLIRLVSMNRYVVTEAANAEEGLAIIRSERPDMVLLDVNMPGEMDGLQMLETMRDDPDIADTPVVMMTGRGLPSDRYFAAVLGASAYFCKPFSPLELADRIETLLATGVSQRNDPY